MHENKSLIYIFLNICSVLLGFIMIFTYLWGDICTDHDFFYIFDLIRNQNFFYTGRFVSVSFTIFYYFILPKMFNIHINDVSTTIVPFFSAGFISLSTIFLLKIFYLFSNKEVNMLGRKTFFILYPLCFVNIAILPLINNNLDVFYFSAIHSTLRYYDHLFCFVFLIIFIYYAISLEKVKRKSYLHVFYILNAFILGISTESLPIISVILFLCFFTYYFILYKKKCINSQNIKYFFIAGICLISGSLLQFSLSSYTNNVAPAYTYIEIFKTSLFNKERVLEYLKVLYRVLIKENLFLIILILLLQIAIIIRNKTNKNNLKKRQYEISLFSAFLFISYLFLYLFLFFIDGAEELYNIKFFLEYFPVRIMYYKVLLIILFLNCGYLINTIKSKYVAILLHIICILFPAYSIYKDYDKMKYEYFIQKDVSTERKIVYISDKMALKYYETNAIAILPISYYRDYSQYTSLYRPVSSDNIKEVRDLIIKLTDYEVNLGQSRFFTALNNDSESFDNDYLNYLKNSYNIKLKGLIFVDNKIAFKLFKDIGGNLTEEELKFPVFSKLKRNIKHNITENTKLNENQSMFYATKCRYNIENGNNNEAIGYCTEAIDKNKNEDYKHYEYFVLRGEAYYNDKKINEAIKDYEFFIKKMPLSNEIRNKLIAFYVEIKDYKNAIRHYKEMIDIFPYYSERGEKQTYYNNLAKLQYIIGDDQAVIDSINMAENYNKNRANYKLREKAKMNLKMSKNN